PIDLAPLHAANVPQPICDLIRRCTEKAPGDRPQGFDSISREIERIIQTIGEGSKKRSHVHSPGWIYGVVGLLALAVVLVLVLASPYFDQWIRQWIGHDGNSTASHETSGGTKALPPTLQQT